MKKGEKRVAFWLGIALLVSLAVVAGMYFLSEPHLVNIDENLTMEAGGVSSLSIEGTVSNIVVRAGGGEITARLYGMTPSEPEFRARLVVEYGDEPGKLIIREHRDALGLKLGGGEELTLEVGVPEGVNGIVMINSLSGDIGVHGLAAGFLSATSLSGDIEAQNCVAPPETDAQRQTSFTNGSGSIELSNVSNDTINVSSMSGGISADMLRADKISMHNVSGLMELEGLDSNTLEVSSDSGDIDASVARLGEAAMIDAVSGSIALRLPEGLTAAIDAGSVSGLVDVKRTDYDEGVPVTVATISGSIEIN